MASTNKTTNYELSQFVETDKPAWLTDYNSDMRKLDTALKAVSDVADSASGGISSLTDRMTAAEGGITTNANDIDVLEARADALEAGAQSTAGTIAGIQTEQTAQNLGIEAATELGYNLARPYDSASTYTVGSYVLFQNTLYKCVTAVATGEAFDPTKWIAIKATDEIAAGGYTLPIASASQLGGVKVGSGLSIDGSGVLSAGYSDFIVDDQATITAGSVGRRYGSSTTDLGGTTSGAYVYVMYNDKFIYIVGYVSKTNFTGTTFNVGDILTLSINLNMTPTIYRPKGLIIPAYSDDWCITKSQIASPSNIITINATKTTSVSPTTFSVSFSGLLPRATT